MYGGIEGNVVKASLLFPECTKLPKMHYRGDSIVYQQNMEVLSGSQLDIQEAASHSSNMFLPYTVLELGFFSRCLYKR